jgi:hypothetical protein
MLKSDFLENYDIVYSGNDLIIEYELELRVDTNSRSNWKYSVTTCTRCDMKPAHLINFVH